MVGLAVNEEFVGLNVGISVLGLTVVGLAVSGELLGLNVGFSVLGLTVVRGAAVGMKEAGATGVAVGT